MSLPLNFEELIGKKFSYYGSEGTKFKLGRITWEAIEDESDGCRSYLDKVQQAQVAILVGKRRLATVRLEECENFQSPPNDKGHSASRELTGYKLVDTKDGHVWLAFGTDNEDDYYPSFMFINNPKKN